MLIPTCHSSVSVHALIHHLGKHLLGRCRRPFYVLSRPSHFLSSPRDPAAWFTMCRPQRGIFPLAGKLPPLCQKSGGIDIHDLEDGRILRLTLAREAFYHHDVN